MQSLAAADYTVARPLGGILPGYNLIQGGGQAGQGPGGGGGEDRVTDY